MMHSGVVQHQNFSLTYTCWEDLHPQAQGRHPGQVGFKPLGSKVSGFVETSCGDPHTQGCVPLPVHDVNASHQDVLRLLRAVN